MSVKESRRELRFSQLSEITAELKRLLNDGYEQTGDWNLAQTCLHLNEWMKFPMDGFPRPPFFARIMLSTLKMTRGKSILSNILESKSMAAGGPTMPDTVFEVNGKSDGEAVQELSFSIERLEKHRGRIHDSPLFGEMDKDTLEQLQLVHCAHHLSFLHPKSESND